MSVQCASCHINYRVTKDLLSSTCSTHHRKALIAKAESEFEEAKKEGMRLFTDSSFLNYLPAKKAWAKLRRLQTQELVSAIHAKEPHRSPPCRMAAHFYCDKSENQGTENCSCDCHKGKVA